MINYIGPATDLVPQVNNKHSVDYKQESELFYISLFLKTLKIQVSYQWKEYFKDCLLSGISFPYDICGSQSDLINQ